MTHLTLEQEIRARALDAAVTLIDMTASEAIDIAATMFVAYIETGAMPEAPKPKKLKAVT